MMCQLLKITILFLLGIAVKKAQADEPSKIIGGTNAISGEFPYHVSLRYRNRHFCGGALISNKRVLTAAHCVRNKQDHDLLTVSTGSIFKDHGQIHEIGYIYKHRDYIHNINNSWVNDIAIIELKHEIVPNKYQKPIPLAKIDPPANSPLYVTGWGWVNLRAERPYVLQKMNVFSLDLQKCRLRHRRPVLDTHMCTNNEPGVGTCTGDSGGPLVYNGQIVGTASWVIPCAFGFPDIYTRVTAYSDFIENPEKYSDQI